MTGTDDRLDEIEARADAATPGPWEAHELEAAEYCVLRVSEGDDDYGDDVCSAGSMTDAQFIAVAREDVPWLAEQLRDARAEIERLNLVVAAMDSQADENITEVLALTADRDHWRTEWEDADAKRITAEAELAAERAKVERVEALCDEYRTNCDPDTKQAQVAEIFRAALAGGEKE